MRRPIIGCLVILFSASVLPAAEQAANRLPKVRVAPNGNYFLTSTGQTFVPFGVNYFRPGTGWAPQVWKKFDAEATRRDFALLKSMGGNCVRVFLTYGSFYNEPGVLNSEGLAKLDQFLALAEEAGLYVHPTGPDHWEGYPKWLGGDPYADAKALEAIESFWTLLAARYKGRNVIFAYDLLNEPMIRWNSPAMQSRWGQWAKQRYGTPEAAAKAWGIEAEKVTFDALAIPPGEDKLHDPMLLDYQRCREEVADEWTRRQAQAIKQADPEALVTVGLIQWSVPVVLGRPNLYSAFRPERQAKYLDFLEFHFYPLANGALQYDNPEHERQNLAYAEAIAREVARLNKPIVLAEYGWHGGGSFPMGQRQSKPGSEEDQARWCAGLLDTTAPLVAGWLNWGFFDHPESRDVTVHTGLLTRDGKEKAWGTRFKDLAVKYRVHRPQPALPPRPDLPWDACLSSSKAADQFRAEYYKAFTAESGQPQKN